MITGAISHAKTIDDILGEANTYLGNSFIDLVEPEVGYIVQHCFKCLWALQVWAFLAAEQAELGERVLKLKRRFGFSLHTQKNLTWYWQESVTWRRRN